MPKTNTRSFVLETIKASPQEVQHSLDFFLRDHRIHDQNRRIVVLTKLDKTIPYKTTGCKYLAPQDDGSGNEYNYYIFQLDPSLNISVRKHWKAS